VGIVKELMEIWLNEVCDIDNVLVGTEDEKQHDKIVEEVLKRIEENDLYIKPKKCI